MLTNSQSHLVIEVPEDQSIITADGQTAASPASAEEKFSGSDVLEDLKLKVNMANHCHNATPPVHDEKAQRQMIVVTILVVVFMIGEFTGLLQLHISAYSHFLLSLFIGGLLANSLAVMSDAAHMLVDLLSFLISLSAIWIGKKPASRKFSFGYHRFGLPLLKTVLFA